MSAAIAGSEVAITVESMFSMNRATATISGTMRLASMDCGCSRCAGYVDVCRQPKAFSGEVKSGPRVARRVARSAGEQCVLPIFGELQPNSYEFRVSRAIDRRQPKTGRRVACETAVSPLEKHYLSVRRGPATGVGDEREIQRKPARGAHLRRRPAQAGP